VRLRWPQPFLVHDRTPVRVDQAIRHWLAGALGPIDRLVLPHCRPVSMDFSRCSRYYVGMVQTELSQDVIEAIEDLARRYLWWPAIAAEGHSSDRMLAQIMRFGTYEDIRKMESIVYPDVLAELMRTSAPGWFDDRSWSFWRGRLSLSGELAIPEQPPKRTFAHEHSF
jgi:hypothetical protein